jgi:succinate-acetate transporter protein
LSVEDKNREMAVGNTFGATALTSYGGFWISLAITFTPGGFEIASELTKADGGSLGMFYDSLGLFLMVRIVGLIRVISTS